MHDALLPTTSVATYETTVSSPVVKISLELWDATTVTPGKLSVAFGVVHVTEAAAVPMVTQ